MVTVLHSLDLSQIFNLERAFFFSNKIIFITSSSNQQLNFIFRWTPPRGGRYSPYRRSPSPYRRRRYSRSPSPRGRYRPRSRSPRSYRSPPRRPMRRSRSPTSPQRRGGQQTHFFYFHLGQGKDLCSRLQSKGQLISECPFDVLNFPKNQRKKIDKFLPQNLKSGEIIN